MRRIYRKEGFKPRMKEQQGDGILIMISINVSSITTHTAVPRSTQRCIHPGSLNRVTA